MKKLLTLLISISCLLSYGQQVPSKPNPPRLVNDLAQVMTADQVASLESKLVAYDDSTSNQVVIVTVPTIGDDDISDFALKIMRDWGVGNKKTNNGIVILAAIKERKVFIATGYGLEGAIPDITAKQIVDNEIIPHFKAPGQDNYYRGFDQATDAIARAAAGEYKAPEGYRPKSRGNGGGGNVIGIGVIALIILFLIIGRGGGGRGGGGLFSGGGMLPFILGSMLGSSSRGGGWGGGSGGGWSGGDSGGGGGFGGFGGGSGGGGGAGGSW